VAEDLPFEDEQFDYIMCIAVLEHTLRPWEAARELCRVLRPGGKILVDWPFLQNVHGYPHHYFNATTLGAVSMFEPECEILSTVIGLNQHPIYSIWSFRNNWQYGLNDHDRGMFETLTVKEIVAKLPQAHLNSKRRGVS
jgi:SAM-dependent methyltransferase